MEKCMALTHVVVRSKRDRSHHKENKMTERTLLDGKFKIVTSEILKAPWGGSFDGSRFRCYMCGHKFVLKDLFRFLYAAEKNAMNCLICEACDGPDVLERWVKQYNEAKTRFWWVRNPDPE